MTISISGTVYTDTGSTTMGSGRILNCSVNGAASSGNTTTASDGTYTISGITAASAAVLTIYIQDGVNTEVAVCVTRSTGSDMTSVDLYQDYLNLRSDDGTALSGTNVNTSDTNGATGISAIYAASSNTALTGASGKHLCIMSGQTFTPGGATTINVTGNWLCNGTYTIANGNSVTLKGTGSQTIKTNGSAFQTLTINGSGGTYTLQDNLTFSASLASQLNLTAGTLDVSTNNYSVTFPGAVSGFTGTSGAFTARSGTVVFNSTSSSFKTLGNLYNLTVGGSILTLTAALTVTNNLTINSGKKLTISGQNLTTTGATFVNSGTLQLQGGETLTGFTNDTANGGTVIYVGSGTTTYTSLVAGSSYKHLLFNGTGRIWQPAADVTVTSNLTITAGTLDMSSANNNVSVAGNWANSGTFTPGTGTVTLNGTSQTISGSTTFYNLTKIVAAADTLTFTDGTTQTVSNALTLHGASGQLLTLAGTSTGGWTIAVPATQTLDHLSVSYSTATGNTAVAGQTSVNGGNNVNWTFAGLQFPTFGFAGLLLSGTKFFKKLIGR